MSGEAVSYVRIAASDAARRAGRPSIEPAHLVIGLCELSELADTGSGADSEVLAAIRPVARELRLTFATARIDPTALRRRIRRRLGIRSDPTGQEAVLPRSPASRIAFERAADLAGPEHEFTALDLLRALLEEPVPQWAEPAAELGVDDLLAACFAPGALQPDDDRPSVSLEVVDGPVAGRRICTADPARWLAGRGDGCQLVVPDRANSQVSRHHALFEVVPPWVRVQDLGSTNGTAVNDEPLAPSGDVPVHRDLVDGDLLRLADTTLRVGVHGSQACVGCGTVLVLADAQPPGPTQRCPPCRAREHRPSTAWKVPTKHLRRCLVCDEVVVPDEPLAPEPELCRSCREEPDRIVEQIARRVDRGEELPRLFSGYTLRRYLGRGGMGAVYLARDEQSDDDVAIKLLLPTVPTTNEPFVAFLREAESGASLDHRHVVRQREHAPWYGVFYIVTDYCDGGDLEKLIRDAGGRLPVRRSVVITRQLLQALDHAHRAPVRSVSADGSVGQAVGLVHRDISPGNVLFAGGVLKVADFGLSKAYAIAGRSEMTEPGDFAGKHGFMPRRQVSQYRDSGPEVDVWAAMACLYFMLTGSYPRDFDGELNEWKVVLERTAIPVRHRERSIPQALAGVIDRALAEEPRMSFTTAGELVAELDRLLVDLR